MFWSLLGSSIIIFLLKTDLDWPEKLKIPEFLFDQIFGWPAFYGYRSALGNSTEEWDNFWDQLFDRTEKPKASREFSGPKCSLTRSFGRTCYTIGQNDCQSNGLCVENWITAQKNVICQDIEGEQVRCAGRERVSKISYNTTTMILTLSNISQFTILSMPDKSSYYYDNATSNFAFVEMSDRSRVYLGRNRKTVVHNRRVIQQNIDGILKLCQNNRCVDVNNTDDSAPQQLHLDYILDRDKAVIKVEKDANDTRINLIPQRIDTKTPIFWKRRGRFYCPSDVTCLLEIIYFPRTLYELAVLGIFICPVLFYMLYSTKHIH